MKYQITPINVRPWLLNGWSLELIESHYENNYGGAPVVVFCVYRFHVGCKTAITLRKAGYDTKYMKGGHSGSRTIGGPVKLHA